MNVLPEVVSWYEIFRSFLSSRIIIFPSLPVNFSGLSVRCLFAIVSSVSSDFSEIPRIVNTYLSNNLLICAYISIFAYSLYLSRF